MRGYFLFYVSSHKQVSSFSIDVDEGFGGIKASLIGSYKYPTPA